MGCGYFVNGSGTDGPLPAGGANGDTLGFTGGAPGWLDPAEERAVLGIETVYDFATAEGWTAHAGGDTAAITGGVAHLTIPSGAPHPVGTGDANVSLPPPQAGLGYRVVARLAAYTGADAQSRAILGVSESAVGGPLSDAGAWVGAVVRSDGTVEAFIDTDLASPGDQSDDSAISFDGTGWLCVESVAGHGAVYFGTGEDDAEPTSWTLLSQGARDVPFATDASIGLFLASDAALGAKCEVRWDHVRVRAL